MTKFTQEFNNIKTEIDNYTNNVIFKKYCINDEKNYDDVLTRFKDILDVIITNNKDRIKILDMLNNKRLIPAGSISFGLGNHGTKSSLSNCYYIPIEKDSIEGIFDTVKYMAKTYSYRGGVGTDISILRPQDCFVNNAAKKSTGSISFVSLFSEVTNIIGQKNRRGACLISLDIRHPDAMSFIWCKSQPERVFKKDIFSNKLPDISSANLSLKLTKDFFEAIDNDDDWSFWFPDTNSIYYEEWNGDFDKWESKKYPKIIYNTLKAKDVLKQIAESCWISGDPGVLYWDNVVKWSTGAFDDKLIPRGVNPCLPEWAPVLTPNGYKQFIDIENEVIIDNKQLNCSDIRLTSSHRRIYQIQLDSGLSFYSTSNHMISRYDNKDIEICDIKIGDLIKVDYSTLITQLIDEFCLEGFTQGKHDFIYNNFETENVNLLNKSLSYQFGYIYSFITNPKFKLIQSKYFKNVEIFQLLLAQFSIYSEISNYEDYYELYIIPDNQLINQEKTFQPVVSIKLYNGVHDVYDIIVPDGHHFVSSGIVTHNCGEQPLADWNNCLLSAIVLPKYIKNPYKPTAEFDTLQFFEDIKYAMIFLDSLIDINTHPLKQQTENDKYGRRVGLEFTGMADMLAMLNIEYGSNESIEFLDSLLYHKAIEEIKTSLELAKEKGCAPALKHKTSRKKYLEQPYILRLFKQLVKSNRQNLILEILKYGLRNCNFNTVGPTGTISIVAGNTTSGVEPLFNLEYERLSRIDGNEKIRIIHYPLLEAIGPDILKLSAKEIKTQYNYKESHEINYKDRIKVQSIVQKWTDSSVSSTINLPNNTTVDDIYNIYIESHKAGLKGITIFRDGSKQGVLNIIKKEDNTKEFKGTQRAYRYIENWKGVKVYITVTINENNQPVEVFANMPYEAGIDESGNYTHTLFNERLGYWNSICRLVSVSLRSGVKLEQLVKHLERSCPTLTELPNIIKRVLQRFINTEDKKCDEIKIQNTGGLLCYTCKKETVIYRAGCKICLNCGDEMCG